MVSSCPVLTDAYFTFPIRSSDRKFLKFRWKGQLLTFVGLPMGITCAPRIFTKLITPIYSFLHKQGVQCFPYLDDSFVFGVTEKECFESTEKLAMLLVQLGFKVHPEKSQLEPSQRLKFLGFIIDSIQMNVSLPKTKVDNVLSMCKLGISSNILTIRYVLHIVGTLNSYCVAVEYGGNHFKRLECDQIRALKLNRGNFDSLMLISPQAKDDLAWWIRNVSDSSCAIRTEAPRLVLFADASNLGWGACLDDMKVQGEWDVHQSSLHINAKELLAVYLGLKHLASHFRGCSIHVKTDNTTAVSHINKMGGVRSDQCREVAFDLWSWCESHEIWIIATHIPGQDNEIADSLSRSFSPCVEWEINNRLFQDIIRKFGVPSVDLFASRHNTKCYKYVSCFSDSYCWKVDAFSFSWTDEFFYIFPTFRLVGRCWRKMVVEKTRGILVAPDWPSQIWYPTILSNAKDVLRFPRKNRN